MTKAEREKLAKYRRTKEYMISDYAYAEYQKLLYLEEQARLKLNKPGEIDQEFWT